MANFSLEAGIETCGLPTASAFLMRTSMSAIGSVMLMIAYLYRKVWQHRYPLNPEGFDGYQLALRRPGTSPRMVASRSLLRPRPNFAWTPRERPVRAQRLRWRAGDESRGSFCSLTTASILSSYDAEVLAMIFFSASRLTACCFTSLVRLTSRFTIEVLAMVYSLRVSYGTGSGTLRATPWLPRRSWRWW